jgi:CubicO group peptidase (beta-lactamase class C family)
VNANAIPAEVIANVQGHCDTRFGPVRAAFVDNFSNRGELGATVCIFHQGEKVVDLIGGWRDTARTQRWTPETLANVWSSTKGVTAICFAMLVERGLIRYDQPVAAFWPEFADHGKQAVTIAMLLSHQAGLCGFTTAATVDDLLAGKVSATRLAAQAPLWPVGTASGYHAIVGGILATELFERIEGRPLRQFVAEELTAKHGIDVYIGLPPDQEHRRATMVGPLGMRSSDIASMTPPQVAALANPPLDPSLANTPAWRAADLPSGNGHGHARALAGLYALLLQPDKALVGVDALSQATHLQIDNTDLVLGVRSRWAAGFLLNTDGCFGPNDESFGHTGWGGSVAFADPSGGLSMAYVMNRMGTTLRTDPRNTALIDAVYLCL